MKVAIGIIGSGNILSSHLAAMRANPEFNLVSVCRRSEDKLREQAGELGCRGFTDYHELLAQKPDVVVISLPHGMHCRVTLEAFEAGCHVLVEKPMAVSVDECNRMLEGAEKYKKHLIVTESASFYPGATLTGQKFAAGDLGRFFTGCFIAQRRYFSPSRPKWFLDPAMSGGGMWSNVGLHRLAVIRACLPGLTPVSVTGSVCHVPEYEVEACTSAFVRYGDGGSMLYEEIGYYPKTPWLNGGTHLIFENGIVMWDKTTWRMMTRDEIEIEEKLSTLEVANAPIYANMLRAIRGEDYAPKARELALDTAVAHAAYASSQMGRTISLDEPEWRINP